MSSARKKARPAREPETEKETTAGRAIRQPDDGGDEEETGQKGAAERCPEVFRFSFLLLFERSEFKRKGQNESAAGHEPGAFVPLSSLLSLRPYVIDREWRGRRGNVARRERRRPAAQSRDYGTGCLCCKNKQREARTTGAYATPRKG